MLGNPPLPWGHYSIGWLLSLWRIHRLKLAQACSSQSCSYSFFMCSVRVRFVYTSPVMVWHVFAPFQLTQGWKVTQPVEKLHSLFIHLTVVADGSAQCLQRFPRTKTTRVPVVLSSAFFLIVVICHSLCSSLSFSIGFAWKAFGRGWATGVASVRSC